MQNGQVMDFTGNIADICKNNIYNYDGLIDGDGKHQYSTDPNIAYPTSEKWAYANSKIRSNTSNLYYSVQDGEVKGSQAYNQNVLNKVNFDFEIDEKALSALKIKSKEDFDTYFVVVSQDPIEYSIVNLVSPIFINEKEKLIGQYVTNEKVEPFLATIDKCATLK